MKNSDNQISLLYVDDEPLLLDLTKEYLKGKGEFTVDTALSTKEGLEKIEDKSYDAVVSDYQMPETDGLEFLKILREKGDNIPFIIFTGRGREEVAIEALNAGADYYLQKGGNPNVQFGELQNFIIQAVKKNRAEKTILKHERQMSDFINFLPDATMAIDKDSRLITWNKAMEEMTGVSASEIIGKDNYEYAIPFYGIRRPVLIDLVLHEELRDEVSYPVLNFENKEKLFAEIFLPHLRNGEGAYLWFTASPLYDQDGNVTGAIESIRDITSRKNNENTLKMLNKKLKLLSSITRHDIKNQISVIMGYNELLELEIKDEDNKKYLKSILNATETIQKQIEFTHDYQDIGLNNPVWNSADSLLRSAASNIQDSHLRINPEIKNLQIYADHMLEKVVYNIFENSINHGGNVTRIKVSFCEKDRQGVLIIEDNGKGVPNDIKEKIFEQGVGSNTGLGLFLAREILDITHVSILETGTEGKGARFEIVVPQSEYRFKS